MDQTDKRLNRLLHYGGGLLVEGIGPQGKRKKIRIIVFQVPHIVQPLMDQLNVGSFYVPSQMGIVCIRQVFGAFSVSQFLGEMKNRPQKLGEFFML